MANNGFGRIGRAAFKILLDTPELELVNEIPALATEIKHNFN